MNRRHLLAAAGGLIAGPRLALAQGGAWPTRMAVRIVVPFPPAGFSDFVSRVLTAPIGAAIGGNVVIENRPGAGGTVGADNVAKSPADGYSFIVSHVSPHGTAPGVYPQLPYNPVTDFTHCVFVCDTPTAVMVRKDSPFQSFEDWMAAAKGRGVRVGTSGIGSIGHLQSELLSRRAGLTKLEHVPYRGTAPAIQDLLSGTIESIFEPVAGLIPQLTGSGQTMRMLVLSGKSKLAVLPDVPLLGAKGYEDVVATAWMGFSGPKGLPADIARKMTDATVAAIARPDVKARMEELAVFAPEQPLTGEAYTAFIREFSTKWTAVAKAANIVAS